MSTTGRSEPHRKHGSFLKPPEVRRAGKSQSLLSVLARTGLDGGAVHKPLEAGNNIGGKLGNWRHEFKEMDVGEIADDCYDRALDELERYELDEYGNIDPWSFRDIGVYSRPARRSAAATLADFDDVSKPQLSDDCSDLV